MYCVSVVTGNLLMSSSQSLCSNMTQSRLCRLYARGHHSFVKSEHTACKYSALCIAFQCGKCQLCVLQSTSAWEWLCLQVVLNQVWRQDVLRRRHHQQEDQLEFKSTDLPKMAGWSDWTSSCGRQHAGNCTNRCAALHVPLQLGAIT